ncbi:uncharacterized protein FIBRA_02946 [Fibroporia radiculosa]|uniref:Uncharacterized protein n=1 Tax=Fibroporia radiculosa TaxID=599839 RepID=J4GN75_9APHY|nr:uncharacterized protein FIBRA_02946 [Fibroporia radiculosa]CCM00900.1 predicted protein [Fibroporia radiculosa]
MLLHGLSRQLPQSDELLNGSPRSVDATINDADEDAAVFSVTSSISLHDLFDFAHTDWAIRIEWEAETGFLNELEVYEMLNFDAEGKVDLDPTAPAIKLCYTYASTGLVLPVNHLAPPAVHSVSYPLADGRLVGTVMVSSG